MSRDLIIDELKVGKNPRTLFGNVQRGKVQVIFDATTDADNPANVMTAQFGDSILGANVIGIKGRGTIDAPADVQNNDNVFAVNSFAYSGGSYFDTGGIHIKVDNPAFVSGQNPPSRVEFHTSAPNVAERLVGHFSSEGYFGIGTAFAPGTAATRAAHPLHVVQSGADTSLNIHFEAYEGAYAAHVHVVRARGTFAAPSNVVSGDNIGRFIGTAYSNGLLDTAEMRFTVDDTVVAGQRPASRISFRTNESNAASRLVAYFSREGYLGLGTAFEPNTAATRAAFDVHLAKNDTVGRLVMRVDGYGTSADGPYIGIGHARGTFAVPANNVDGDNLGDYEFYAYAGGWQQAAEIRSFVTGAVSNGVTPSTNMTFKVATGGAMVTRMQLFSTGRIGMGSASRASETDAANNGTGALWIAENANRVAVAAQYSASDSNSTIFLGRKSRGGSLTTPTTVANGDNLATFRPGAYTDAWFDDMGYVNFAVDAAVVSTQRPATRFEVAVNANNASASVAFQILSTKVFVMGSSMSQFTDAAFNYNLSGGVDQVVATYGQNGGAPNSMIFGYSTYSSGYTNGHPARMVIGDSSFSCNIRWDVKKTGASSNTLMTALMIDPKANMPNVSFFSAAGSYGLGQGVIAIANRDTAPSLNPSGGGVLYAESGALKWRGSGGTTTTIANA